MGVLVYAFSMLDVRRRKVVGASQLPIEGYGAEGVEWRRKERVGLDGRWSIIDDGYRTRRYAHGFGWSLGCDAMAAFDVVWFTDVEGTSRVVPLYPRGTGGLKRIWNSAETL